MPKKIKPWVYKGGLPTDPDQPINPLKPLEGLKLRVELQYGPIDPALYRQTMTELERQVREVLENVLRAGRLTFNVDGQPVEPQMGVVPLKR